jgi:hypothetical protein
MEDYQKAKAVLGASCLRGIVQAVAVSSFQQANESLKRNNNALNDCVGALMKRFHLQYRYCAKRNCTQGAIVRYVEDEVEIIHKFDNDQSLQQCDEDGCYNLVCEDHKFPCSICHKGIFCKEGSGVHYWCLREQEDEFLQKQAEEYEHWRDEN